MKKATKRNRKYLIGGGRINTSYQLLRVIRSMSYKNPNTPIMEVKLRIRGKNRIIKVC